MGTSFFTGDNPTDTIQPDERKEINIKIPDTTVKLQMHYILTNWTRELKITTFPAAIMKLIVNNYAFQPKYAAHHALKLERQKLNMPLEGRKHLPHIKPRQSHGYAPTYDYLFKLLVLGSSGVGKTCLCYRYCDFTFGPQYISNIGVDFRIRTVEIDNKQCKLQIWDTAGQQRFRNITRAYYRGVQGVLLVYDVTDEESFRAIKHWNSNLEKNKNNYINKILVGNKMDIFSTHGQVVAEDAKELCDELNIPKFIETSAKTGENVQDAFNQLAEQIYEFQREIDEKQLLQPFRDFKSDI